jgi:hypothetical protein
MMMTRLRNWPPEMWNGLAQDYVNSLRGLKELSTLKGIRTFCCFLGHSRSGHSAVASLLDAHRHIVLADEIDAFKYTALPFSNVQVYHLLLKNSREIAKQKRERAGYTFSVPNQWQGRFENIQVIGEKNGSVLATMARRNPALVDCFFSRISSRLPIKVINLYRNPFDVISTIQKRHIKRLGHQPLRHAIDYVFDRQDGIECIRMRSDVDLFDVEFESFLANPESHLTSLCEFLGVDAPPDYISDCRSTLYDKPRQTRFDIEWPKADRDLVQELMERYPYLRAYSYET